MWRSSAYRSVAIAATLVLVACGRSPLDGDAPDAGALDASDAAGLAPDDGADAIVDGAAPDVLAGDAPVADAMADVQDARVDAAGDACVAPIPRDGGNADAGIVADWAQLLDAEPRSIARDAEGNVFVTGFGGVNDTMGLTKLDPSGHVLWAKTFGNAFVDGLGLAVDAAGAVVVVGFTGNGSVYDFGAGNVLPGGFAVKFSPDGALVWQRIWPMGPASSVGPSNIQMRADGAMILAGGFNGTVDLGAGPMVAPGRSSVFVAELDPCGATKWSRAYGAGQASVGGLVLDATGAMYLTGLFEGALDFGQGALPGSASSFTPFVARLDASGIARASRAFTATGSDVFTGAPALHPSGDLLVTGSFDGTLTIGATPLVSAGSTDFYVARLTPTLATTWASSFGDAAEQDGNAVAAGGSGDVLVTGRISGSVPFGGGALVGPAAAPGNGQLFVARLTADGAPVGGVVAVGAGMGDSMGLALLPVEHDAVIVGGAYVDVTFVLGPASFPIASAFGEGLILRIAP